MITEGASAAKLGTMVGGAFLSLFGAAVSWMDHAEQLLRMAASCVAIISGCVVIFVALRKSKRKGR